MEGDNCMFERILRTVESIFNNDSELKEFSIIPTAGNVKNKSPVVYEEHNLGLESWCVKHVYRYAYLELFEVKNLLLKLKQNYFRERRNLNHLLMGVLLINPEVSTFWNLKRELVKNELLSIEQELLFSKIVLSYKSKSNVTFEYRRWLINRLLTKIPESNIEFLHNLIVNELDVCELAAGKNQNNYHAWTHRIWCIKLIEARSEEEQTLSNIILNELGFSYRWLTDHISEHTSYHYRQFIFNLIKKKSTNNILELYFNQVMKDLGLVIESDPKKILLFLLGKERSTRTTQEELYAFVNFTSLLLFDLLYLIPSIISTFPDHESMWYHRRYLIHELIKTCFEYHEIPMSRNSGVRLDIEKVDKSAGTNMVDSISLDERGVKKAKLLKMSEPNKVEASFLYKILCKTENDFMKRACGVFDKEFAQRHAKWLKFVVGMEYQGQG